MSKATYYDVAFWEERYKQNICEWYQWLATPNELHPILSEILPNGSKILQLGCGSSNFAQKLATQGHNITCVDFSKELIKHRTKTNTNSNIIYKHQNILQKLNFQDEQFDIIIQKNTLDCLFCHDYFIDKVLRCMRQCYRVLKSGGKMISVTHGKQKHRKYFYRNRFSPFGLTFVPFTHPKTQNKILVFILTKDGSNDNESNHNIIEEDQNQNEINQSRNKDQNDDNDQDCYNKDQAQIEKSEEKDEENENEQDQDKNKESQDENNEGQDENENGQNENNKSNNQDNQNEQNNEEQQYANQYQNDQGQ